MTNMNKFLTYMSLLLLPIDKYNVIYKANYLPEKI